jgi:putative ABC transport system permease protein
MLRNYLAIATRNLYRHKSYTLVNLAGLATGLACCLLVGLFVREQLRYGKHNLGDRVYRVLYRGDMAGSDDSFSAGIDAGLAAAARDALPALEAAARVGTGYSWFEHGDKTLRQRYCLADVAVFDMFDLQLLSGDPRTLLTEPGSMVVTESAAKRFFDDADPIGAMLTVSAGSIGVDYRIVGVVRDIPKYGHLQFDVMTASPPTGAAPHFGSAAWEAWSDSWHPFSVYFLLRDGTTAAQVEVELPAVISPHRGREYAAHSTYRLQPLSRIHLYSRTDFSVPTAGDIGQLRVVGLIGLFILSLACINFTNLATARSAHRAREVGLRKVLGAHRQQLVAQFLGEAILIAFAAAALAVLLAWASMPLFGDLGFSGLTPSSLAAPGPVAMLALLTVGVGVLAGAYPAIALSSPRPAVILKTSPGWGRGALLRRGLVVFQFSATVALMVSTAVVHSQTRFMKEADVGLNTKDVVLIPIFFSNSALREQWEMVKERFAAHRNVLMVSAIWGAPGDWQEDFTVHPEGEDAEWRMQIQGIDNDFLETFEIDLVAGRNIHLPEDGTSAFLLNETAVRQLGWDDPIGKTLSWKRGEGPVVGVVADYHATSLHTAIEPTFFCDWLHLTLAVRMAPYDRQETLAFLRSTWHELVPNRPNRPASIQFLDWEYGHLYGPEERQARVLTTLTGIAVFVACLGVLGLSSYSAEQRTREISIRRILGSSVAGVLILLAREPLKAIGMANLIAWPLVWFAMTRWLQDYPYAISLDPVIFVLTGVGVFGIALASFGLVTFRVVSANPAQTMRAE